MKSIAKALLWIVGVCVLLLIPATGGKIFDAVTNKLGNKEAPPIELKDIKSEPGLPAETFSDGRAAESPEQKNALEAKKSYLRGLEYFQEEKYEKAREEWLSAGKLDPANQDIKKGLSRVEAILTKP